MLRMTMRNARLPQRRFRRSQAFSREPNLSPHPTGSILLALMLLCHPPYHCAVAIFLRATADSVRRRLRLTVPLVPTYCWRLIPERIDCCVQSTALGFAALNEARNRHTSSGFVSFLPALWFCSGSFRRVARHHLSCTL